MARRGNAPAGNPPNPPNPANTATPANPATPVAAARSESALVASVDMLRAILDAPSLAIAVSDADGILRIWNPAAERLFGFSAAEVVGRSLQDLPIIPPEGLDFIADARRRVRAGERLAFEAPRLRRDGTTFVAGVALSPIHGPGGLFVGMLEVNTDVAERTRLEEQLRRSEHNLAEAQRIAHIGSWEWDLVTDALHWSDEHCRIYGIAPGAFAGTNLAFHGFVHPDDLARVREADRRTLTEGARFELDFRIVRPDGQVRIVRELGEATRDETGRPVAMLGTTHDITEQVAADRERERLDAGLRRSERSLAEAQRIAHIGSWEWGARSDAVEASDEMCRILGIEPAAFGRTNDAFMAFVHPDDRAATDAAELAAIEHGIAHDFTYRVVRPDGEVRIVHEIGDVIRDEAGTPSRMVGTVRDITEQLAAEVERSRLISAVEQTADSVMVWEPAGTILYVNPAFCRLYGYEADEVVGRHAGFLDSGEEPPAFWDDIIATVQSTGTWSGTIVNRHRDGSLIQLASVISGLRDATGQISSHVQTDRNITRERELEGQLRQAQKMEAIGRLAGGIAHDFNNLLTGIRGFTELARDPAVPEEQRQDDLRQIIANVDRAAELTRGLLAFGRRALLRPQVLDPMEVVAGIVPLLRRLIGEHIELRAVGGPLSRAVRADRSQLEQVIVNLSVNARDAMPTGGVLTIAIAEVQLDEEDAARIPEGVPGPYVEVSVADTGNGMDDATRARVFEPFFTTKPTGEGIGLGLSSVYGIIRQSGGMIVVVSEPGEGATFRILLPAVEMDRSEVAAPDRPAIAGGGSETILLVEDDAAVRTIVRRVLAERGYTVLEAADGAAAQALASSYQGSIDLLLTDVVMPGLAGPDLARLITESRPTTRVLFVSGYPVSAIESPLLGAGAYLAKPFTTDSLLHVVRERLDAPGAE